MQNVEGPPSETNGIHHTGTQLHVRAGSGPAHRPRALLSALNRGVRWWNSDCDLRLALTGVYSAHSNARKVAIKHLRRTIASAKCNWAHEFLHHTTSDKLWEAAAWRKGRSINVFLPF